MENRKKLYRVTLKGMTYNSTGVAYGLIYDYLKLNWKSGLKKVYNFLKNTSDYAVLETDIKPLSPEEYQEMSQAIDKKPLIQFNKSYNLSISKAWQAKMIDSASQLREKMALFWHGHVEGRKWHLCR